MKYLLRAIESTKWYTEDNEATTPQPRAFPDLRVDSKNGVSVFEIDDEDDDLIDDFIVSSVINRLKLVEFQYVKLNERELKDLEFDVNPTAATTKLPQLNNAHKDIHVNSVEKLVSLANYIFEKINDVNENNIVVVPAGEVQQKIQKALDSNKIKKKDINIYMRKTFFPNEKHCIN